MADVTYTDPLKPDGTDGKPQATDKEAIKRKLLDWWVQVREHDAENRREMAIDEDFVDGLQWTDEDRQILEERGQAPLVFNEIRTAVEWVLGTERRTRIDWKVEPRTEDDIDGAQIKTKVLKYISDVNKFQYVRSRAFESAVNVGVGWIEVGFRGDAEEELIFQRYESWRNIWRDPMSSDPLMKDARFLFRSKLLDLDIAQGMFPKFSKSLEQEADDYGRQQFGFDDYLDSETSLYSNNQYNGRRGGGYDDGLSASVHNRRKVIRLLECWYREPAKVQVIRSPLHLNQIFDPEDDTQQMFLQTGLATLTQALRMRVMLCMMTVNGTILSCGPSPYRHNRFPFVPVCAYTRGRDNAPYGVVRNARDPQMDLNKRRSKSLFMLSTNRVIADENSVEDPEAFEDEVSRPNAIIWKKPGAEMRIENNVQLSDAHVQMGLQDSDFIRQISGVTGENLGLETNATSGRAIQSRQEQGTTVTATLFDNLKLAQQMAGELTLSLVEQYYDEPRIVRLTGERRPEFLEINMPTEDGGILNDITARQADYVVSDQPFSASVRRAMFETMLEMTSRLGPEVAIQLLDLVMDFSDLPNKDELARRIREINGQPDPDDPQALEAVNAGKQQQQELSQQQQQAELEKILAEIELKLAQAKKYQADSVKSVAETQRTKVETQRAAVDTGRSLLEAPDAGVVGDAVKSAAQLQ